MKSAEQMKAYFRDAAIATNPEADKAVLANVMQVGGLTHRKHPAPKGPRIWRFLMESRITKLTAAGLVIAAAILGVHDFNGASVKAVEFSEITKAMSEVQWMHMTASGFPNEISVGEQWIGFEARIHAGKESDGTVTFASEKDHKRFIYHPNTTTITISYMEAFPLDVTSPTTLVESMYKMLKDEGAKVVAKMGEYKGRRAQVQTFALQTRSPDGIQTKEFTLYIDLDSKLLYGAELSGADTTGKVTLAGEITFDYPETGPQSIYDLGVPRGARIVDETPTPDVSAVLDEYRRCQTEATREYIAVIAHQEKFPSEVVRMLDVEYKSQRRVRQERHLLSPRGEVIPELGARYREQFGKSLEPLLAWARHRYEDPDTLLSVHLYDGQYYHSISRDDDSGWGERNKAYSPTGDVELSQTVIYQAWPTIPSTARIVQDDYAQQNGLIGIENLTQGQVLPQGMVGHPGRFLYYLDPARDYLCRRQVMEWRPNADWQQDKTWLKNVDPKKVGGGGMVVWEITEVFQAPNGHWYPRVIVQKQTDARENYRGAPLKVYDIETIYLDLSPTFPGGIFDPKRLPGR
jgi:hypothetical protein